MKATKVALATKPGMVAASQQAVKIGVVCGCGLYYVGVVLGCGFLSRI